MALEEIHLSEYGKYSTLPSPVNRMMAEFAHDFRDGVDINLGVGYVNEDTIPRKLFDEAQHQVSHNPTKYRSAYNYGDARGSRNLSDSLRNFLVSNKIGGLTKSILAQKEIIIGTNGATSILEGLAQILPRGLIITADPVYYIYCNFLERIGFQILAIPEDQEGIDIDLTRRKIMALGEKKRDEIRFFYIVTVNNPTCSILTNDRRKRLIEMATGLSEKLGRKIPVIFDKAYENLVHDPQFGPLESGFHYDEIGIVYEVNTLSKILAPGLRIGYMIGPDSNFLKAMIQRASDVGFSAPLINQEIASYMLDKHALKQIRAVNHGYRKKAIETKKWIDTYLGEHLAQCRGGHAGFYYYLTFKSIETVEQSPFFRYLSRTTGLDEIDGQPDNRNPRVIYIPGSYCVHSGGELVTEGRRQLRLSYGFETIANIEKAIKLMRAAAEYAALQ